MTTVTIAPTVTRAPTWRSGLATAAIGAAVTTAVAALLQAAGLSLEVSGEEIPLHSFAQGVLMCSVVGIVLARHLRRTVFVTTTVALTVLSLVPDALADAGTATKLGLMLTHVVAAAVVIPRLAVAISLDHVRPYRTEPGCSPPTGTSANRAARGGWPPTTLTTRR